MTAIQSCAGGWCTRRDHCAHYHAASPNQTPSERLCPPGHDGAGLQSISEEVVTITRATRQRVLDVINEGAPLRVLSERSGVHISNVRMVASHLDEEGSIYTARAGTGQDGKHELWAFMTAEARDVFVADREEQAEARQQERERIRAEQRRQERAADPHRTAISIAAERREAERARKRAEAAEAKAVEKASRIRTQAKLRKQTASAGVTVFKAGTSTPKPKPTAWADQPALIPEGLEPIEIKSKLRDRFAVEDAPPLFSSLRPGQYIAPSPAWVEAVAA